MIRVLGCIAIMLMINCGQYTCMAQVTPANRSVLNYRLIGFSVPEQEGVTEYEFEVSEFIITDTGTTIERPVFKKKTTNNRLIEKVPYFDRAYAWKVHYYNSGKLTGTSEAYRFATGYSPYTDTTKYRLRVLTNEVLNKDLLVFIDGLRAIFDMKGNALWYLPDIPEIVNEHTGIRDMKLTPQGTITFLTTGNAYEIDYNGNILWKGPELLNTGGDRTEGYHHEFTRLSNGNYMVLGSKIVKRKVPNHLKRAVDPVNTRVENINGEKYLNMNFGTVMEYDQYGQIVWSWESADHFSDNEIFSLRPDNQLRSGTHMNSFYFDESKKHVYTSYRNINTILKTNYPSGNVIARYGEGYVEEKTQEGLFYGQHACRINSKGQLYLFNNNNVQAAPPGDISSIIILEQPANEHDPLKKVWEYTCNIDTMSKHMTVSGGSVIELNTGDMLVCMGEVNRNFIVTLQQQITWNALVEKRDEASNWLPTTNCYRSWPIQTRQEQELLIYSTRHDIINK